MIKKYLDSIQFLFPIIFWFVFCYGNLRQFINFHIAVEVLTFYYLFTHSNTPIGHYLSQNTTLIWINRHCGRFNCVYCCSALLSIETRLIFEFNSILILQGNGSLLPTLFNKYSSSLRIYFRAQCLAKRMYCMPHYGTRIRNLWKWYATRKNDKFAVWKWLPAKILHRWPCCKVWVRVCTISIPKDYRDKGNTIRNTLGRVTVQVKRLYYLQILWWQRIHRSSWVARSETCIGIVQFESRRMGRQRSAVLGFASKFCRLYGHLWTTRTDNGFGSAGRWPFDAWFLYANEENFGHVDFLRKYAVQSAPGNRFDWLRSIGGDGKIV